MRRHARAALSFACASPLRVALLVTALISSVAVAAYQPPVERAQWPVRSLKDHSRFVSQPFPPLVRSVKTERILPAEPVAKKRRAVKSKRRKAKRHRHMRAR